METEIPLLDDVEAGDLIDPAAMIDLLLSEATLLSDEAVTWQGRPARFLVIRPDPFAGNRKAEPASAEGDLTPLALEARIWLDESGVPLAMERSMELRFALLTVTEHQAFTFQQVDGRLLVDEARETYSGTALAVLRGRDSKKMKVIAMKSP